MNFLDKQRRQTTVLSFHFSTRKIQNTFAIKFIACNHKASSWNLGCVFRRHPLFPIPEWLGVAWQSADANLSAIDRGKKFLLIRGQKRNDDSHGAAGKYTPAVLSSVGVLIAELRVGLTSLLNWCLVNL